MEAVVRKWAAVGISLVDNGQEIIASHSGSDQSRLPELERAVAEYLSTKFFH